MKHLKEIKELLNGDMYSSGRVQRAIQLILKNDETLPITTGYRQIGFALQILINKLGNNDE